MPADKRTKDHKRILTIFRCPTCGHASTRRSEGTKLKRVIEWGSLWEEKLQLLWSDLSLSVTHIKHALHSDHMTIKRRAAKASLPFPRLRPGRPSVMRFLAPLKKMRPKFTIEARRAEYVGLRNAQPTATGRQLPAARSASLLPWSTWAFRFPTRPSVTESSPATSHFFSWIAPPDHLPRDVAPIRRGVEIRSAWPLPLRRHLPSLTFGLSIPTAIPCPTTDFLTMSILTSRASCEEVAFSEVLASSTDDPALEAGRRLDWQSLRNKLDDVRRSESKADHL